jgi:hypothetical protein
LIEYGYEIAEAVIMFDASTVASINKWITGRGNPSIGIEAIKVA